MLNKPPYRKANTIEELAENLATIQARIALACERVGRDKQSVRLLPVTKTVDEERLRMAYQLGCTTMGENKVQEALAKYEAMQDLAIKWSIIGHLQTNKIKYVARFADEFQALDSLKVAEQLNERLRQHNRTLDVLIQVNTSGEESKYGLVPQEVATFIEKLAPFKQLNVKGLMTLALFSADQQKVRDCFILLRQLRDSLRDNLPEGMSLEELSMGMSGDFEIAIEEGATIVRIGQTIFGARNIPDWHYWPENNTHL